jgi:hypothetical protein
MTRTLLTTKQYKLDKSLKSGVITGGITLSPAFEARTILNRPLPSSCAMSGHCAFSCLVKTGHNQFPTHARARATRTALWYDDRSAFLAQAVKEFTALQRKAARQNMIAAGRPNILSDLPVMARAIAKAIPSMNFYDYTKIPKPWLRTLDNYSITYSVSERSTVTDIQQAYAHGINCAVVVDTPKGEPLPKIYTSHGITKTAIDGDINDLRFQDPKGVFVLLRWKGSKTRLNDALASGWVQRIATSN